MDAAIELWMAGWYDEITLAQIAERSGISLSTILRRYGSKEGILEAVLESDRLGTFAGRRAVASGDLDAVVAELVDDYERVGDAVLRNLALEDRVPPIGRAVKYGRAMHREWVGRVFGPWLPASPGADYDRRFARFVVATDVYTWRLLRRDQGLSRAETARALRELIDCLVRCRP